MKVISMLMAPLLLALVIPGAVFAQGRAGGQGRGGQAQDPGAAARPPVDTAQFNPTKVTDPFEPIVNAPFIRASEVQDQVRPEELVLGIVIDREARAYPINMLTGPEREIINDQLGGRAIAATW